MKKLMTVLAVMALSTAALANETPVKKADEAKAAAEAPKAEKVAKKAAAKKAVEKAPEAPKAH